MLRRILPVLTVLTLVLIWTTGTRAETYVPPLTFNAVSAMAKEKDVKKGLETALKEQNVQWFWELGGGLEKAMTANSEAEFTDALGKKVELIKTLHTVGMAYAEGNYSDAAIAIADSAVSSLNNPAATAVWEMIKLTRESYIEVKKTKDALNIEELYHRVNTDRRLIGSSSGGQPPTINIDSSTVDYFFNKYLITDPAVRGRMQSYVENVLGQQWPEESWGSYMTGLMSGSSDVTKAESELRQLQSEEFKNVARGWIRSLLADVNKQVTLEYYRMRVRQEMAEYSEYANKVANFYETGFPAMWEILRRQKVATEKIPEYEKILEDAEKAVSSAQKNVATLKNRTEKERAYKDWSPVLNEHDRQLQKASVGAYDATELNLYDRIDKVRGDIGKIMAALAEGVEEEYDGEPGTGYTSTITGAADAYFFGKYFAPYIRAFDVEDYENDVEKIADEGVDYLNRGDFTGAKEFLNKALGSEEGSVWYPLYYDMAHNRKEIAKLCPEDPLDVTVVSLEGLAREKADEARRRQPKMKSSEVEYIYRDQLNYLTESWKKACRTASDKSRMVDGITGGKMSGMNRMAWDVYDAFEVLRGKANEDYARLSATMQRVRDMTWPTERLREKDTDGKSLYAADENGGWCKSGVKIQNASLYNFGGSLKNQTLRLKVGGSEQYIRQLEVYVQEETARQEAALELWNSRLPLEDIDIQMIAVLTDKGRNVVAEIREMKEHVSHIPGYVSAARADVKKYIARASSEYRDCTGESETLTVVGDQLDKWQKKMLNSKLLRVSEGRLVPGRIGVDRRINVDNGGMAYTDKPYRHYMTFDDLRDVKQELLKNGLDGGAASFLNKRYPEVYKEYMALIGLEGVKPAPSENMIFGGRVIYLDDIEATKKRFVSAEAGKDSFVSLMEETALQYPEIVKPHAALFLIYIPQASGNEAEYESKTGKAYVELAETIKKRWEDHNNAISEEMRAEQQAAVKKWEKEQEELANRKPLDASGYWIVDPRVNSERYPAGASQVLLMQTDTVGGKLYLSGRINTLENVEKVLLSIDGRRTWQELPRVPVIAFYLTPQAGATYEPFVHLVRYPGFDPVTLSLSNGAEIVFSNQSYSDRIVNAMKLIAESYERQNLALFGDLIADDYLGGRVALEEGVRFDFEMFSNIQLKLYVNRITQAGAGKYVVSTKWDKTQTPRSTGAQQKTSGATSITLVEQGGALKIQNLRGDLLYATLSPDIASASGLTETQVTQIREARDSRNPVQPGAGTSESGGGTSAQGVALVATKTITKTFGAGTQCYDFDNDVWAGKAPAPSADPAGSDICFEGASSWTQSANAAAFQDMSGANSFASLSTAPDAGYAALNIMPGDLTGKVHAFKSSGGKYGKMELTSAIDVHADGSENVITFKFAVQTDGTTNVATQ
ncbi:MAG: hypothetical protein EOM26_11215 [Alphaproteobacteria bacterium]|nr:hypothetical protein [Alphaproteobacteria bacterium]